MYSRAKHSSLNMIYCPSVAQTPFDLWSYYLYCCLTWFSFIARIGVRQQNRLHVRLNQYKLYYLSFEMWFSLSPDTSVNAHFSRFTLLLVVLWLVCQSTTLSVSVPLCHLALVANGKNTNSGRSSPPTATPTSLLGRDAWLLSNCNEAQQAVDLLLNTCWFPKMTNNDKNCRFLFWNFRGATLPLQLICYQNWHRW